VTNRHSFIPYFLAIFVVVIIVFCAALWRVANVIDTSTEGEIDSSTWLLLGLLLVGVFGLGVFLMYALLYIG
jgi:hypothetical protein